jgi:hypothetical protein
MFLKPPTSPQAAVEHLWFWGDRSVSPHRSGASVRAGPIDGTGDNFEFSLAPARQGKVTVRTVAEDDCMSFDTIFRVAIHVSSLVFKQEYTL